MSSHRHLELLEVVPSQFAEDEINLAIPKKLFFRDFCSQHPNSCIDLSGWLLTADVFLMLKMKCNAEVESLVLDDALGFETSDIDNLRGSLQKLESFSLRNTINMSVRLGQVCGSWLSLTELDVSQCSIEPNFFKTIAKTCKKLSKLICHKCPNLDDFELQSIGECIAHHRQLTHVDLSQCNDFSDEGILSMTTLGQFILKFLCLSGCRSLTSLAITGLRKRMPSLTHLDISSMLVQQSPFEWISEGCQYLLILDVSRSLELDDIALSILGSKCGAIEKLNVSHCPRITDAGIVSFFQNFLGSMKYLDLSGNITCGGASLVAIATKSSSMKTLKINGLSQVSGKDFLSLWANTPNLENFEMAVNLRSTTLHRHSMIPHISDDTILKSSCTKLMSLKLTGAVLVTDVGAIAISQRCKNLTRLDISYCMDITNQLLITLGVYSKELIRLNITGCGKVSDIGMAGLCCGCTKLTCLEASGCVKLTDESSKAICRLLALETLSLRGCDYLTDTSIIRIAKSCKKLKHLDISNLDFVTQTAISAISANCPNILSLSSESCAISSHEFLQATIYRFPCVQPVKMRCKVEVRARPIFEYNKFIASMDRYHIYAKRLQRFSKFVSKNSWIKLYNLLRKQSSTKVQALFRGNKSRQESSALLGARLDTNVKATRLQKAMRRLFGIKYAKDKLNRRKLEDASRRLLQRAFRGYAIRIRTRQRFIKLYENYQKLGLIFYKYWIMANSRFLHRQILMVQAHFRGWPIFMNFKVAKSGFIKLQRLTREIRWRKQTIFTQYNFRKLERMKIHDAATTIKIFIRAVIFNRNILPFTVFCARYYDNLCSDQEWSALRIQTQWRRFSASMQVKTIVTRKAKILQGQIKLLVLYKGYLVRKRLRRSRFVTKALIRMCRKRCRLIVGLPAKKIQQLYRLFRFRMDRIAAARTIERVGRGHLGRNKWRAKMFVLKTIAADRIVRYYRRYIARSERKKLWKIQHRAARKIQHNVRMRLINNWESKRRINAGKNARLRREALQAKADLLTERRIRVVGNIRLRQHNKYARVIQKCYRKYKHDKDKRDNAKKRRQENAVKAREELKEIKANRRWGILPKISRTINETLRKLRKIVVTEDDIPREDNPRLTNGILKFQTRSIVQEGIVELALTLGETEKTTFTKQNIQSMHSEQPYFEMIDGDLSGSLELGLHIWVRNGHGVGCICTLEVSNKPQTSLVALRAREKDLRSKGFRLAWHKNVHVELKGECTVMLGKGGFAIRDIHIAQDETEEQLLEKRGFQLVQDLHQFNLPTSIWAHSRQPFSEDGLYKYGTLTAMDWFDKRMIRCIQAFNLSEGDVLGLRVVFEGMQGMNVSYFLSVKEIFNHMGYPWKRICEWVVAGVNPGNPEQLSFSEYVQMVCYFCLFGKKELFRFVFGAIDLDQKAYLRKEEFCSLIEDLTEGTESNVRLWQLQYKHFSDPKLGYMFYNHFEAFGTNYNMVMFQVERLHELLQSKNLGQLFWDRKREQYKVIREDLGVKLVA